MFKPIIIRADRLDQIAEAIAAEQGRARERTISAADVVDSCEEIAARLSIPKKHMEGIRARVDRHAQTVAARYRFPMESTQFSVEYRRGSWRLLSVSRSRVAAPSRRIVLDLPEAARVALVSRFSAWE